MIRGAQKRMVVLRTADSEFFEEVYFVLRRNHDEREGDIIKEANRIIESAAGNKKRGGYLKNKLIFVSVFLCGGGVGALAMAAIYALVV